MEEDWLFWSFNPDKLLALLLGVMGTSHYHSLTLRTV